jgi:ABC-type phosphate/phosphonate transport system substrate-binding protein
MVVRPLGPSADARDAAADFAAAVLERSGVVIEVQLVERYAEGLAALCASPGGQVSVAWLNAPTYMAARAQSCGLPVLQVEKDEAAGSQTGQPGSIIVTKGSNIRNMSGLSRRKVCRISNDDFYSWFVPSLLMRAEGLDPLNAPASITDLEDIPALVQAVADRDCDAAGIPAGALVEDAGAIGDAADKVTVLTTTVSFPYSVLMLPIEMPLDKRLALVDALTEMSENRADAVIMRSLLAQDALKPASVDDFTELADFMDTTGLDFSALGN